MMKALTIGTPADEYTDTVTVKKTQYLLYRINVLCHKSQPPSLSAILRLALYCRPYFSLTVSQATFPSLMTFCSPPSHLPHCDWP